MASLEREQGQRSERQDAVEKAVITSEMIAAGGDDLDEVRQATWAVGGGVEGGGERVERKGWKGVERGGGNGWKGWNGVERG